MQARETTTPAGADRRSTRTRAVADLAAALPLLLLFTLTTWTLFDLSGAYVWHTLGLYAGLAALVLATVPAVLPGRGLGAANRVTLGRAMVTLPVAALVGQPAIHHDGGHWWVIVLATAVMVTDGFDGWTARRTGTATPYGARFDMELDSVLMLALALLVASSGKVGAWVVAAGLPRYLFVAAGWLYPPLAAPLPPRRRGPPAAPPLSLSRPAGGLPPPLAAPLPPRRRRQTVCVVQGIALLVALGPIIPPPAAAAAALLGLAALVYSFGVDVVWTLAAERSGSRRASTSASDGPPE